MSNMYVERHDGKYVVIQKKQELATANTQAKAAEKAHKIDPEAVVLAGRVRTMPGGKPDKWRRIY